MKYKADQLKSIQKFKKSQGFDPRSYSLRDKATILENLQINLFLRDF